MNSQGAGSTKLAIGVALIATAGLVALVSWLLSAAAGTTLQYIQALAWPLVALTIAFMFRRSIRALFDDVILKSLAGAGVTVEFDTRTSREQPTEFDATEFERLLSASGTEDDHISPDQLELTDDDPGVATPPRRDAG